MSERSDELQREKGVIDLDKNASVFVVGGVLLCLSQYLGNKQVPCLGGASHTSQL